MLAEEGSARAKTVAGGGNSTLEAAVFTTAPGAVDEAELDSRSAELGHRQSPSELSCDGEGAVAGPFEDLAGVD